MVQCTAHLPSRSTGHVAGPLRSSVYRMTTDAKLHHKAAQYGTNHDGSFLKAGLCGNGMLGHCTKQGTMHCAACSTVQYCSKECQANDWATHKSSCLSARFVKKDTCPPAECRIYGDPHANDGKKREVREVNEDEFLESETWEKYVGPGSGVPDGAQHKKYLWGRSPPLDILNLAANEGVDYNKPLQLNFKGVDDLRHIMKTIASVPESYTGTICSHIYEADFDLQIRNIVILLLAMQYPNGEAAELITHLWYSASIPYRMYLLLHTILETLKEYIETLNGGPETIKSIIVVAGFSSTIEITMSRKQFEELYSRLNISKLYKLDRMEAKRLAFVHPVNPALRYRIKRFLGPMLPYHRMAEQRYRDSGMLLPMNTNVPSLRCVNPTFYNSIPNPLLHPLTSPLDSHDALKLDEDCIRLGIPRNDHHGAVFFGTRDLITAFCARVANLGADFVVCTDPEDRVIRSHDSIFDITPYNFEKDQATSDITQEQSNMIKHPQFDRILPSRFVGELGASQRELITDLGPLLTSHEQNPHATIVVLLPWATDRGYVYAPGRVKYSRYLTRLLPSNWHVYTQRVLAKFVRDGLKSVHEVRRYEMMRMEEQDNLAFVLYIAEWKIRQLAESCGLEMKSVHQMSIGPPWPYRLRMRGTEMDQERQFELRFTSLMRGCERLVEFKTVPRRDLCNANDHLLEKISSELQMTDINAISVQPDIDRLHKYALIGVWDDLVEGGISLQPQASKGC